MTQIDTDTDVNQIQTHSRNACNREMQNKVAKHLITLKLGAWARLICIRVIDRQIGKHTQTDRQGSHKEMDG